MNIHENACVTPAGRAHRPDRDLASPAHDGRADRDPALQGALVALEPKPTRTQAHSNPSPLEPKPTRTQAARPALRIRQAWRYDPYRHEKARPHREKRPSHHRRQNKPEKDQRHWLGGLPDEKKETACAFTSRACANGLTQRRIDHPLTGPAPSSSGPFGARQTRCRDQHQGRRDCDGDRAHGHAEPERPLFELLPDIGRHRMRANWR